MEGGLEEKPSFADLLGMSEKKPHYLFPSRAAGDVVW